MKQLLAHVFKACRTVEVDWEPLTYPFQAVLVQVPCLMRSNSDTSPVPHMAVAPPLRKLCSENRETGIPRAASAEFQLFLRYVSDMTLPSFVMNSGADWDALGVATIMRSSAASGQNALPGMTGRVIVLASLLLWSVLDHFSTTFIPPGTLVMSPLVMWRVASKALSVSGARFDCLNRPVNAKHIAQITAGSWLARRICVIMHSSCLGVMGSFGDGVYLELTSIDLSAHWTLNELNTVESKSSLLNPVEREPMKFLIDAGFFMFGLIY